MLMLMLVDMPIHMTLLIVLLEDDHANDGGDIVQELAAITESKEREDTEMEQELAEVSQIGQLIMKTLPEAQRTQKLTP